MDLLFLHEKFYRPLPPKLKDFKKNINRLLPSIFDTKNIIHRERRRLEDELGLNFQTTSLTELFQILDSDKGRFGLLYSPAIDYATPGKYNADNRIPHEAGYDSYLAGYVFLRLAHLFATRVSSCFSQSFKCVLKSVYRGIFFQSRRSVLAACGSSLDTQSIHFNDVIALLRRF